MGTRRSFGVRLSCKKLHGRTAARLLDDKSALGKPDAAVLARTVMPAFLRGLWLALDQWGAAQYGVSLQTFRLWRRKLQKSGDLRGPTLRGPLRAQQVRRHRAHSPRII
jgi:hypothetical protein